MERAGKIAILKPAPMHYEGIVRISVLDKGGYKYQLCELKNSGTRNLFQLICRVLLGITTQEELGSSIPQFLAVGNAVNPTLTDDMFTTMLNSEMNIGERIFVAGKQGPIVDRSENEYSIRAKFAFAIPSSSVGETPITEMGLCSTKDIGANTVLARVITQVQNDGINTGIVVPKGKSLLVDWEMVFRNI